MDLTFQIKQSKRPFLISGPCSAESSLQLMSLAESLSKMNVNLLRAGIWKPRTRPGSFEGLGDVALPWLIEASKQFQIPVAIEVANAQHVESALKHGVDVLWIGARTTVNPFAVQEIADVLKGVNVPVMIKNPINPDLNLWLGAFERMLSSGLTDLVAIHRGFSAYAHSNYRNNPNWEIPITFKEKFPEIPMICDPSHIAGKRDLLLEIAQKGMDLNMDGLMIECHPEPDNAWSDAEQQITPIELADLLNHLVLRSNNSNFISDNQLNLYRSQISDLDDQLFEVLFSRMKISEKIGDFKKEHALTVFQNEHWFKVIEKRIALANKLDLSEEFVRNIMEAIHQESIRHQMKVMNQNHHD